LLLDRALNTVGQSDDAIDMTLTVDPTAANKTLVLFEKHGEIIADNLSKAAWSLGWASAIDVEGRTIWIVDAHGYGKRFIVRADEKPTALVELERKIHEFAVSLML
jgi:hypothetical protein